MKTGILRKCYWQGSDAAQTFLYFCIEFKQEITTGLLVMEKHSVARGFGNDLSLCCQCDSVCLCVSASVSSVCANKCLLCFSCVYIPLPGRKCEHRYAVGFEVHIDNPGHKINFRPGNMILKNELESLHYKSLM